MAVCASGISLVVVAGGLLGGKTRKAHQHYGYQVVRESGFDGAVVMSGAMGNVRGPEVNAEAEARHAAYREALSSHGIAFDERWSFQEIFSGAGGGRAVQILLDERRVSPEELDAVVAATDLMAMGPSTHSRAVWLWGNTRSLHGTVGPLQRKARQGELVRGSKPSAVWRSRRIAQ